MRSGVGLDEFGALLGKAFLIAVHHHDRENAIVFARALLTRLPAAARHPR